MGKVQQLPLWSTPLYKFDTSPWLDVEEVFTELVVNVPFEKSTLLQLKNIDKELIPLTLSAMQVQHERVWECLEDFSGNAFREQAQTSWMFYTCTGEGLESHLHSSPSALFTSVLYLTDSLSELVLMDPRGNACRGYPKDIKRSHFGTHRIRPKAGELYLFPCYVEHFAASAPPAPRLSILSNYFFETIQS